MSKTLVKLYDEMQERNATAQSLNSEGFTKWVDEFINPSFTTEYFENSRTVNREHYEINKLHFMSSQRGYPTLAIGKVHPKEDEIPVKVWWDQDGKCRFFNGNKRFPDWDLVRPDQSKIDASKSITTNAVIALIVIIICSIF